MKTQERKELKKSLNSGVIMNVYFSEYLQYALTPEEFSLVTRLLVNSPAGYGGGYATEKLLLDVTVDTVLYEYESDSEDVYIEEEDVYKAFESLIDKGILEYSEGHIEFHVRELYKHLEKHQNKEMKKQFGEASN